MMNKKERFKALLERGYFPEELPPPFHTRDIAKYRSVIHSKWAAIDADYPKTIPEVYSIPRIKKIRRNLSIVNPVAQLNLAKLISDNWIEISKHLKDFSYSIDFPDIKNEGERAVSPPKFNNVTLRKGEMAASFDYALASDISRFYGTLYTHAIPWALHGKTWCKKNLNNKKIYDPSLGARLDKAVRKGQDNQTIGIPVGPDTSRIISEIIGVSLDRKVQEKHSIARSDAFRYVDDWYIGFDNAGDAEKVIATLAGACRDYELELNVDKTIIEQCSTKKEPQWSIELRQLNLGGAASAQLREIERFFLRAFNYSEEYNDQNVLDYAVKMSKGWNISKENWPAYETYLLRAARANPTAVPAIVQIIVNYNHRAYKVGKNRISKLINDLIVKNAPLAHYAEVAWALFLCKALRIQLSKQAVVQVCQLESSVCALLALDLEARSLTEVKLDTSVWALSMNDQGLRSNMWLLSYEADLKGWMSGVKKGYVEANPYFAELKSKKISFYNINTNVSSIDPKSNTASKNPFSSKFAAEFDWDVFDIDQPTDDDLDLGYF